MYSVHRTYDEKTYAIEIGQRMREVGSRSLEVGGRRQEAGPKTQDAGRESQDALHRIKNTRPSTCCLMKDVRYRI